jgi:hypothetical protein
LLPLQKYKLDGIEPSNLYRGDLRERKMAGFHRKPPFFSPLKNLVAKFGMTHVCRISLLIKTTCNIKRVK